MMKILYLVLTIFVFLLWFTGCKSVTYEYDEPIVSDTLKITADTAKLKNPVVKTPHVKNYFIRSSPSFTLQINGGYNIGLSELSVNTGTNEQVFQFEDGQNFGARNGFGFSVVGKKPFLNYENIRLVFIGAANFFSNNKFTSKVSDNGKINYQVYSIGAGFENSFTPSFKIKPYIGAAILVNAITGHGTYVNDDTFYVDLKINPSFRVGVNLSAGLEYLFSDKVGWNFGISVTSANLLFKQSHISDDPYEVYLRDRRRSDIKLYLSGYKQFLYTSFYMGVNIYFGIKEKAYRF
jgi:hypothetical protein